MKPYMLIKCLKIIRNMKNMSKSQSLFHDISRKENFSSNVSTVIDFLFLNPIKNRRELLDRSVTYCYKMHVGQSITQHRILKGLVS